MPPHKRPLAGQLLGRAYTLAGIFDSSERGAGRNRLSPISAIDIGRIGELRFPILPPVPRTLGYKVSYIIVNPIYRIEENKMSVLKKRPR